MVGSRICLSPRRDRGSQRESDRSEFRQGHPRGAGPSPWSRGSVLSNTENWAVGRAVPGTSRAAHSGLKDQGQWLWLIFLLAPLPASRRLPPWKERQFGDYQSKWLSLSGSGLGKIASRWPPQGPSQRGRGQGWARRCGQWPGERAERLPLPGVLGAARFLARSQLKGPLLPCPVASHRTSLRT